MKTKGILALITLAVAVIIGMSIVGSLFHRNNIAQLQVIQSFTGKTSVKTDGGIYWKVMPTIWTYNKTNQVAFSFVKDESKDNDGVHVFFSNKGQGDVSTQVTYNIMTEEDKVYKMHALAKGDDDVIDRRILAFIREVTMREAGLITSSEAIEKREDFANSIRKELLHNTDFQEIGIDITQFTITNIEFDAKTIEAYDQARDAELQKKTAEAQKQKFIMEKERVQAEADMQIAESKGKAEVEKTKAETDAEKTKRLAEIEAEQRVAVAELDKKEAEAKAQKEAEVAKIEAQKQIDLAELKAKEEMVEAQKKIDVAELVKKEAEVEAEKLASVAKIEAEKTKDIAVIEAEKEKEVAIIDMNTKKEQALIQKDAEATNLEIEKLVAEQVITKAKAEKEAIEVGGKMSEKDKLTLTVVNETKVKIADAVAKGLNGLRLPGVMYFGGGFGANGEKAAATAANYFGDFMNLLTVQKATELANQTGNVTK